MRRTLFIAGALSLLLAVLLGVKSGVWEAADKKAAADVALLSDLTSRPDRVSLRLSEDLTLRRALIWNAAGDLEYPPPGRLVPLAYEFSDEVVRELTATQQAVDQTEWSWFDLAQSKLLYCSRQPAICLIYDRASLEAALDLQPGALTLAWSARVGMVATGLLGVFLLAAALWLGRAQSQTTNQTTSAIETGLQIIPERHVARRGALEVALTPRDLKLLSVLQNRAGAVVTKDELYDRGWGRDYMPNSRALDQHMINLRRKLDPDKSLPAVIETVRGVGYRLVI